MPSRTPDVAAGSTDLDTGATETEVLEANTGVAATAPIRTARDSVTARRRLYSTIDHSGEGGCSGCPTIPDMGRAGNDPMGPTVSRLTRYVRTGASWSRRERRTDKRLPAEWNAAVPTRPSAARHGAGAP